MMTCLRSVGYILPGRYIILSCVQSAFIENFKVWPHSVTYFIVLCMQYIGRCGLLKDISFDNETAKVHYTDNRLLLLNKDVLVRVS